MSTQERRGKLTRWQLFTLVANSLFATGVYTIARTTATVAGRGFVIAIPLAVAFALLQLFAMYQLARRFPEQTLPEYAEEILGKYLGKVYLLGYFVLALGLSIVVPRNFWLVVSAWVYQDTPQFAFMLPLMLVCWNIARRGLIVVARMSEVYFLLSLPILVALLIPHGSFDMDYLRPVLDKGILDVLKGVLPAYFSLTGFDIFLFVYPFTDRKRVFGAAGLGITVVGIIYTAISVLVVGTLGFELTLITTWPMQQYLNHYSLPVLERLDVVVLILWVVQVIMTVTIPLFSAASCLRGVWPGLAAAKAANVALPLLLVGAFVPVTLPHQMKLVEIYSMASMFYVGLLPAVLWLIAVLRKKQGGDQHERKKAA